MASSLKIRLDVPSTPENDATIPTHTGANLPNIESVHVAHPTTNSNEQGSSNPSERDIYIWTITDTAVAKCFARDAFSMKDNNSIGPNFDFYWLGHVPCRSVHIVGVVVGIDVTDRWTVYTKRRDRPLPPPPPPATAIGYPVEVIGKVKMFRGRRQIQVKVISVTFSGLSDDKRLMETRQDRRRTPQESRGY
ncbi:hypothetical protein EDD22DRAFT_851671 [Suillus occidentalis]|nr:hypothetical protein EDD22DRAFT_851671 [Suillus occidentalis]